MKKQNRKLQLRTETIQILGSNLLDKVVGGQRPPWSTMSERCTNDIFCPSVACY